MAEQTLIIGSDQHLVATLTPATQPGTASPPWVAVLTNSGVIPRSGPHRMNVHLARRFAEMGIPSIRFDMSGLGDSGRSGSSLPMAQQWISDARSAMDTAQARFGGDRFFMVGFCSGAEVAHRVALEDPRLRAAVLWDLYAFPTLQSRLRTLLYKLRRWGALGVARKLRSGVLSGLQAIKKVAATERDEPLEVDVSRGPTREEFAGRIQALADSGVELLLAYSGGEPERFNHRGQFRAMFEGYGFVDKVLFSYLEISDHLITRREAQHAFTAMVTDWLTQRVLVKSR